MSVPPAQERRSIEMESLEQAETENLISGRQNPVQESSWRGRAWSIRTNKMQTLFVVLGVLSLLTFFGGLLISIKECDIGEEDYRVCWENSPGFRKGQYAAFSGLGGTGLSAGTSFVWRRCQNRNN